MNNKEMPAELEKAFNDIIDTIKIDKDGIRATGEPARILAKAVGAVIVAGAIWGLKEITPFAKKYLEKKYK
jgi:hypothetical protein